MTANNMLFRIVTAAVLLLPIAAKAQCTSPDTPLRPIMKTHTFPPYPQISVMTSEQGTVMLLVSIGADGIPTDVQIDSSSGSLRLDEAARDYVKETWRWQAPVRACLPLAVKTRVSVKWDLRDAPDTGPRMPMITMTKADFPADALARHEQGMTVVGLVVSPDGQLMRIEIIKRSGFDDLDNKAIEIAKARYRWVPARMGETAITTLIYLAMTWPAGGGP